MKDQKKQKGNNTEEKFGMVFTVNESLNKYSGPEFEPPKLKEIEKKFSKQIIIHR